MIRLENEILAEAIHNFYRKLCKNNNWDFKYDMKYVDLPEDTKNACKAAASRIPGVLACIELEVVPESQNGVLSSETVTNLINTNMETLAKEEHEGWMEQKKLNGWKYGVSRSDEEKTHNCMKKYEQLTDDEKEKDRNRVRNYPAVLKIAGYNLQSITK